MGFGILTVANILLMNVSRFAFTDAIVGILYLWSLNKLRVFNKPLKAAFGIGFAFLFVGVLELACEVAMLFGVGELLGDYSFILSICRHLSLQATIFASLLGVRSLAVEVGVSKLAARIERTLPLPILLGLITCLLEMPFIASNTSSQMTSIVAGVTLLLFFAAQVIHTVTFFYANMYICMPEDLEMKEKPSRFKFVNDFRRRSDEKEKELQEYRIEKMRQKAKKKRK